MTPAQRHTNPPEIPEIPEIPELERLLSALRTAEPHPGLEQRVLHHLRPHPHRRRSSRPATSLLCTAVALGLLMAVTVGRQTARMGRTGAAEATLAPAATDAAPKQLAPLPARIAIHAGPRLSRSDEPMPRYDRPREPAPLLTADESVAALEMRAPSKPPPPLPLTHEESRLAQAAFERDPHELTPLNASAREARAYEETAQFEEFFADDAALAIALNQLPKPKGERP